MPGPAFVAITFDDRIPRSAPRSGEANEELSTSTSWGTRCRIWSVGGQMVSSSSRRRRRRLVAPRGPCPFVRHGRSRQRLSPSAGRARSRRRQDRVAVNVRRRCARSTPDSNRRSSSHPGSGPPHLFAGLTRSMRSVSIDMKVPDRPRHISSTGPAGRRGHREPRPRQMEAWGCSFEELRAHNSGADHGFDLGLREVRPLATFRAYASNINNYLGLTVPGHSTARTSTSWPAFRGQVPPWPHWPAWSRAHPGADRHGPDGSRCDDHGSPVPGFSRQRTGMERRTQRSARRTPLGCLQMPGPDAWVAIELEDARDWETMCRHLGRDDLRLATPGRRCPGRRVCRCPLPLISWELSAGHRSLGPLTPFQATPAAAGRLWRLRPSRTVRISGATHNIEAAAASSTCGIPTSDRSNTRASRSAQQDPGRVARRGSRMGEHTTRCSGVAGPGGHRSAGPRSGKGRADWQSPATRRPRKGRWASGRDQ
jgi:hypothetical protein